MALSRQVNGSIIKLGKGQSPRAVLFEEPGSVPASRTNQSEDVTKAEHSGGVGQAWPATILSLRPSTISTAAIAGADGGSFSSIPQFRPTPSLGPVMRA